MKLILSHRFFFIFVLLSLFLGLSGCEQEGSAEKTGAKIDQATEKAGEKIQDTKEAIGLGVKKTE